MSQFHRVPQLESLLIDNSDMSANKINNIRNLEVPESPDLICTLDSSTLRQ